VRYVGGACVELDSEQIQYDAVGGSRQQAKASPGA
jgi:hypothetical protein